jgi:hypothetical protein
VLQLAIKVAPYSSSKETQKQHLSAVVAYFCIYFMSLCAHKTRESSPSKPRPAPTPARVGGRLSFWGAQLCATARSYERLLPGGASFRSTTSWWCALVYHYFQKDVCGMALLPFFQHQIRSTTSTCSTCRLLGTAPPVSLGTTWSSHLLVVFFLFLYRLSANTSNPYDAIMLLIFTHSMICFMIFLIKLCHKMPKSLTVYIFTAISPNTW